MAKIENALSHSTRVSATILLFVFWLTFIMFFTLFVSPGLERIQNFIVMFTSLLLFALGVVYVWSPILDKFQAKEQKRSVKRRQKRR